MTKTEIIKYSREYYEYIEKKILPNEDSKVQLQYYNGEIGYDEDYVKEHLENNNIKLITKEMKGKEMEKFLKDRFPEWEKGKSIFELPLKPKNN
tara:strand:+ start:404 stop:685 length:282 start_codon:yes stop_codon:yes gene_type:complete